MKILSNWGVNLADVCLISDKASIVNSRNDIEMDMSRIIHAPMSANQSKDFIKSAAQDGMSIVIHRFNTPQEQKKLVELAEYHKKNSKVWLAVGLKDWEERCELNRSQLLYGSLGVCVDVAHSFSNSVQEVLKGICQKYPIVKQSTYLMTGNVNSTEGFQFSQQYAGIIRVNIGSGMACSTTEATGFNQGSFSLLKELYEMPSRTAEIIFDGGLKTPGDFAKAFLGGADYCMTGGYFSSALETNSKFYYGGASSMAKELTGARGDYVEGKIISTPNNKISMKELTGKLHDGLASAVSYSGHRTLKSSIGQGTFVRFK